MEQLWPRSVPEGRTKTELIVKTIALHLAVIAAAGHLTSLRNQSRKHSKAILWQLAWFLAVPTYPIATLVDQVCRCASIIRQKGRRSVSLSYCLSAICGMHAVKRSSNAEDDDSVPLLEANLEDICRVPRERDWVWTGRTIVLMGLMVQSVATLILSYRRLHAGQLGEVDIRNAMMALGGVVVHLNSVYILVRNERWEFIPGAVLPDTLHQMPDDNDFGIVATLFVIASTILTSWYFRFHIEDTYTHVAKKKEDRLYVFPRTLKALDGRTLGSLATARDTMWYQGLSGTRLPSYYWLVWLLLLYHVHQNSQVLALLISVFLSLSFVVEEVVLGPASTWKDPLADKLYVF